MIGVEMIWIIWGFLLLVVGGYIVFRLLMTTGIFGFIVITLWLIALAIIFTYAQQNDDAWEQNLINIALYIGSAIGGFLYSFKLIMIKFKDFDKHMNQRYAEHIDANKQIFDQFEKRFNDKMDNMIKRCDEKMDNMAKNIPTSRR